MLSVGDGTTLRFRKFVVNGMELLRAIFQGPGVRLPILCCEKQQRVRGSVWDLLSEKPIHRPGEVGASSRLFYSISVENHCSAKLDP